MKIENLIQLLDNRLREFKLSRDYARMSGDLERMNAADKEVITLEDTLYKLNLLVDTSKSAAIKDAILAEVMMDGSISVLGEYDITPYATDPEHEEKIMNILSKMGVMDTVEKIDDYIRGKYWYLSSPVTGEMIMSAALAYTVDARLMMAIMEQDSRFGTAGIAVRTLNPGNVGNNDDGDTVTYESWQEGVTAVAEWLNRHRISEIISEIPEETVLEPAATSTPPIITPTIATTTPVTAGSTGSPQATSTPTTATSTTTTATTTPVTATSTPVTASSSEETIPVITSTTTTATTTPTTATSTPTTSTSTPATEPTPEPEPEPEPDTTAPVITLNGADPMELTVGDTFSDPGATASDDVDGDIATNIVVGGDTVDVNTVGSYVITYDVSDAAGNPATQETRTVNVNEAPPEPEPTATTTQEAATSTPVTATSTPATDTSTTTTAASTAN